MTSSYVTVYFRYVDDYKITVDAYMTFMHFVNCL